MSVVISFVPHSSSARAFSSASHAGYPLKLGDFTGRFPATVAPA